MSYNGWISYDNDKGEKDIHLFVNQNFLETLRAFRENQENNWGVQRFKILKPSMKDFEKIVQITNKAKFP
jgi:hypothetical protein